MKKVVDLSKVINLDGYGLVINEDVTVYPTDNAIKLLAAAQLFNKSGGGDFEDISKILEMLFDDEDITKLAGIRGFNLEAMMKLIEVTLQQSMGGTDETEENGGQSNAPN